MPSPFTTPPRSLAARNAITKCDQAVAEAEKAYKKAVLDAKVRMNADLRKAQQTALRAGDQDEALAIAAKIKQTDDERQPIAGPSATADNEKTIRIVAAFYGQNVNWLDVTAKVQEATADRVKWSATVQTSDWGDPAPGWKGPRTLLVRYVLGGRTRVKFAYEGDEIALP